MRLYDNDEYRETFMELVYSLLHSDGTNDRANLIIDAFDAAPVVEAELLTSNDPLTLDELREMMNNDWVWVRLLSPVYNMKSGYYVKTRFSNEDSFSCGYPDVVIRDLPYSGYGDIWIAHHNKPEEGV